MSIEKSVVNIKLMNSPLVMKSNTQNSANSDWIDYWTKGFMEVNTRTLVKTFRNKMRLIAINRTIRMLFDTKYPFVANEILMWIRWNQNPSVVALKSIKFVLHGLTPFRMAKSLCNSERFTIIG